MRPVATPLALFLIMVGCDASAPSPGPRPEPARSEAPAPPPMTPEELAEARRKAGFRDDDLAAEKAQAREQGGRQYVREHLAAYRGLIRALDRSVDDIDRSARRWARARDPQRAYRRWREARSRIVADLTQRYRELRREGVDAGSTQALVERIYRQWEDVHNDLGGDAADQARFAALISELREGLGAAELALDEIEQDEDLDAR
jgi:hypothetical protein